MKDFLSEMEEAISSRVALEYPDQTKEGYVWKLNTGEKGARYYQENYKVMFGSDMEIFICDKAFDKRGNVIPGEKSVLVRKMVDKNQEIN